MKQILADRGKDWIMGGCFIEMLYGKRQTDPPPLMAKPSTGSRKSGALIPNDIV